MGIQNGETGPWDGEATEAATTPQLLPQFFASQLSDLPLLKPRRKSEVSGALLQDGLHRRQSLNPTEMPTCHYSNQRLSPFLNGHRQLVRTGFSTIIPRRKVVGVVRNTPRDCQESRPHWRSGTFLMPFGTLVASAFRLPSSGRGTYYYYVWLSREAIVQYCWQPN